MAEISIVGKYEVRREIGRGAMGVVYEAFDPLIKRVVALKTIRAEQLAAEESSTVIARFRREAQAAGRLSHPNIVPIYDFGEDAGAWYIAMEYVKGRELKEAFDANERFATADIVRIMSQILEALEYSHRQGVVHRDIKPANVFLLADGTVKVADFGIAHVEASNLTQVGMVLGTRLLVVLPPHVALAVLGVFLLAFVGLSAAGLAPRVPPRWERWLSAPVGFLAGILGGVTNVPGTPLVLYFHALGMDKHEFVRAVSLSFLVYKLVQLGATAWYGLLTGPLLLGGVALTVIGLGAFALGLKVQDYLAERTFNRLVLAFLAVLGLWLLARALQ